MGEKPTGVQYNRKDHGSNRRGVFSVPSIESVGYRQGDGLSLSQNLADNPLLIELMRSLEEQENQGLGNRELPAFKHKQEIIATVEQYKAIILGGETGSGKSTQVPQFLLEAGYDKIFVLVPRRIIADGLGERIREELGEQLGDVSENHVGIQHGERTEVHNDNRIVVMTPDTFNGMAKDLSKQFADQKVAIIADEIHEANIFTEIATGVAAMTVQQHETWRLIAASATHNTNVLTKPFSKINGAGEVPVVTIEGRPFEVELREDPTKTPMELYAAFEDEPMKTMIFTSGKKEIDYIIEKTQEELDKKRPGSSSKVIFRKLHGELSEVELSHIDDPIPDGYRLVIVSSPAGMSGITIPGVTRVITDGTINRPELDEDGVSGLVRRYLSKAGITQQIGRAGRDTPGGIGYLSKPITIEEDKLRAKQKVIETPHMPYLSFEDRYAHEPAEIYHTNLGRVVLRVSSIDLRFGDINEYIPHRVAQSAIIDAEESLYRLGGLNQEYEITPIGKGMNRFPVSPEVSRGVVEAEIRSRTAQHLAHVALVAAAIDVGGIQDFSGTTQHWKPLIRPTTTDDFIAQLDLMMHINKTDHEQNSEAERLFFYDSDLHPKKIERARKTARKILDKLKLDANNLVLTHPLPGEEALLRRDFTAGMIDLVYSETHRDRTKIYYKNIHGSIAEDTTERFISGRSIAHPKKGAIVAGIPRWYEKRDRAGTPKRYDIIEQILLVDPVEVGQFAQSNGLLVGRPLAPRIEGDFAVEQEQRMFGSIPVGKAAVRPERAYVSTAAQDLLVHHALMNPGKEQRALREIAEELQHYHDTIPEQDIAHYKKKNAPEEITSATIEALLRELVVATRSLSELDRKIAEHVYSKRESINRYFDNDARIELKNRSPDLFEIGGELTRILYDAGQPYITQLSREQKSALSNASVHLPDGREILLQVLRGGEKVRVSVGSIK